MVGYNPSIQGSENETKPKERERIEGGRAEIDEVGGCSDAQSSFLSTWMSMSSTSKTRVDFGGITLPKPLSPRAEMKPVSIDTLTQAWGNNGEKNTDHRPCGAEW